MNYFHQSSKFGFSLSTICLIRASSTSLIKRWLPSGASSKPAALRILSPPFIFATLFYTASFSKLTFLNFSFDGSFSTLLRNVQQVLRQVLATPGALNSV